MVSSIQAIRCDGVEAQFLEFAEDAAPDEIYLIISKAFP